MGIDRWERKKRGRIGREEERRKRTEDRWEGMRKGSGGEEKKGRGMIGKGRKRR